MSRSLKSSAVVAILALSLQLSYCQLDADFEYLDIEAESGPLDDFTINRETDCSQFCYSGSDKCCGYTSRLWGSLCSTGRAQSPINLPYCTKSVKSRSPLLSIDGDQYKGKFSLTNDGQAVVLQFLDPKTVNISGAGSYTLDNIRFHWGDSDVGGSEHCVKRTSGGGCAREAMELQLVHYKTDKGNLLAATQSGQRNAVLVLSLLLRVPNAQARLDHDASSSSSNALLPVLNPVIKQLDDVTGFGDSITIKHTFDLTSWLSQPNMASSYFGSLTVPGCNQVVRWYVLQTPMLVKAQDVAFFRNVKQANGLPILSNRRPMQKRNKRDVQCYQLKVNNVTPTAEIRDPTIF